MSTVFDLEFLYMYLSLTFFICSLLNALLGGLRHFFPYFNPLKSILGECGTGSDGGDVVLTKKQMELLGVDPKLDPGFKLFEEKKKSDSSKKHPFGFGPPLDGRYCSILGSRLSLVRNL